jgi:hypothetical protein
MDEDERCFYYKGFLLMCDPTPLKSGGFRANAVVCRPGIGDGHTVIAESPPGVHVISEAAAVEYSKGWAIGWVDDQVSRKN